MKRDEGLGHHLELQMSVASATGILPAPAQEHSGRGGPQQVLTSEPPVPSPGAWAGRDFRTKLLSQRTHRLHLQGLIIHPPPPGPRGNSC